MRNVKIYKIGREIGTETLQNYLAYQNDRKKISNNIDFYSRSCKTYGNHPKLAKEECLHFSLSKTPEVTAKVKYWIQAYQKYLTQTKQ